MKPIRVLVVDDSAVVRRLLTTVIEGDPELEVVGVAHNGKVALGKIEALSPDIITLDIEMPEMNGLETLVEIRKKHRRLPVIMFSTLTERGASATMEALERGASDYVTKPANVGSVTAGIEAVRSQLIPKVKALCVHAPPPPPPSLAPRPASTRTVRPTGVVDVVGIGSSTGGPNALAAVLTELPATFPTPIVITQHMPPVFTRYLAERLDRTSAIEVREAGDGEVLRPGLALIAPGGMHMTFRTDALGTSVVLDDRPPVHYCKPSVDVMFESLAATHKGRVLAVVLTGMGHDGRDGCRALKDLGAAVVVQDHDTSVVWGMPGAVAQADLADQILPIEQIGGAINQRASRRPAFAAEPTRGRA